MSNQENSGLSREAFEILLNWINSDRQQAIEEYHNFRATLLDRFTSNGCNRPDVLVDETILRVAQAVPKKKSSTFEDRALIFRRIAKKVLREYFEYYVSTQEAFDRLLAWLDPDPVKAGEKYQEIHLRLITVFRTYGCQEPEDMADITINRVMRKIPKIEKTYVGDPALYFSGVAKNIRKEYFHSYEFTRRVFGDYLQEKPLINTTDDPFSPETMESEERRCLRKCLYELKEGEREVIMDYYEKDKRAKVRHREEMAKKLGITLINLRVRIHRIQTRLHECIDECMGRGKLNKA